MVTMEPHLFSISINKKNPHKKDHEAMDDGITFFEESYAYCCELYSNKNYN